MDKEIDMDTDKEMDINMDIIRSFCKITKAHYFEEVVLALSTKQLKALVLLGKSKKCH